MKRAKFSLSHYKLLSCDMGELVPIGLMEVLPGDTFQQATSCLLRVSPLLAPVMHPVHVRIHHWFVPHRLVWDKWEDFITGGPDGMDASVFPTSIVGGVTSGSLADYLGVPPNDHPDIAVSSLPFRGYNLIWNEWYRDQDLQAELPVPKTSGPDVNAYTLQNVAWEKDYFTSARPWTQKGPDVTIPFADSAPVVSTGAQPRIRRAGAGDFPLNVSQVGSEDGVLQASGAAGADAAASFGTVTGLEADLSAATAINVNDLREAFALQRYEEARARYGSRYTEYLRYLGVRSSDARLQRPEYLGGGRQTIQFSEVLQTGPGSVDGGDESVVGELKGHGIAAMRSNRYRRFFEEHGYIFSLLSVKPKTMYSQGMNRTWGKRTKEEFFQKELQHIGQQEVFNKELYVANGSAPDGVFGYQDRYDEYRRMESNIAGDFRNSLDYWHYARIFANQPTLNADFIKSTPTKRPNAVQTEDVLWIMANHSVQARRMVAPTGTSFIF